MHWREIIQIHELPQKGTDTSPFRERLEKFLDYLENTERGQKMLQDIKDKLKDAKPTDIKLVNAKLDTTKANIILSDILNSKNMVGGSGLVMMNVREEKNCAFLDQQTGKPHPLVFEASVFHEMVHVADKNAREGVSSIGNKGNRILLETPAVKETDSFASEHGLPWGTRGVYANMVGSSKNMGAIALKIDTGDKPGLEALQQDPAVVKELQDAIKAERSENRDEGPLKGPLPPSKSVFKPGDM